MNHKEICLSPETIDEINRYFHNNREAAIEHRQGEIYIKEVLEVISNTIRRSRCYEEGQTVYCRKDDLPITQDDIDALTATPPGQMNHIVGNVGDATIMRRWACDSGD